MKTSARTFLVVIDDSEEMYIALRYAARRAKQTQGRVALLAVVEPEEIEAWSVVEQAMQDDAFDRARKDMVKYETIVEDISGTKPQTFYRKGERREELIDLINTHRDISVLVLGAQTRDGGRNPLIQYLTSEKGLKRLRVPLIIVPDTARSEDAAG